MLDWECFVSSKVICEENPSSFLISMALTDRKVPHQSIQMEELNKILWIPWFSGVENHWQIKIRTTWVGLICERSLWRRWYLPSSYMQSSPRPLEMTFACHLSITRKDTILFFHLPLPISIGQTPHHCELQFESNCSVFTNQIEADVVYEWTL